MESSNLHHHQQDLVGSSSSSSPPPLPASTGTPSYCYGAAGSNHAWSTPNFILNTGSLNPNHHDGASFNSRGSSEGNESFNRHHHSSMIQNFGFPWTSSNKIKEELPMSLTDSNFPKFTEMLSSPSSSIEDFRLPLATKTTDELNVDMSEKLLLKTISASSFHFNDRQLGDQHFYSNANHFGSTAIMPSRSAGSFSQIYPSINISNLNQSNSASAFSSSSSLEMNLQALDLLTNARFSGHHQPSSCDNLDMFSSAGFDHHMQQSQHHRSSCSPSKVEISAFPKGATEPKRPNSSSSLVEPSHTPKKSRMESRPSCPPFKVRKEKLGDRIAALQQLVAPFGKTDTASVLMEAIGYIQFLQNQVKTLSVPYMKSSRSKPSRTLHGGRSSSDQDGNIEEERRDLRSRGLCLVPLSCMSYVANVDGGGSCGVWPPPPTYGGAGGI